MKIAFGMIVFEGDYVLKQCLDQVYPFAEQILIAEGPVKYWQDQGKTTSIDETNDILDSFPDPENKIKIHHGQYSEKDEQCKSYMQYINDDIDYLWMIDSDDIYKTEDIKKTIEFLESQNPTSVAVRSCSFYGGFDDYLTGFELNPNNFRRIFKVQKGSTWQKHRPPTMNYPKPIKLKHIDGNTLFRETGVQMYHYSYVFPDQVYNKTNYYKNVLNKENSIDNYFDVVYKPWVTGNDDEKRNIENKFNGVHEFKPQMRGACRTTKFNGVHPISIQNDMEILLEKFNNQIKKY